VVGAHCAIKAEGAPRSSTAREASDRVPADVGRWPTSQRLLRRRTRERANDVGGRSGSRARGTLRDQCRGAGAPPAAGTFALPRESCAALRGERERCARDSAATTSVARGAPRRGFDLSSDPGFIGAASSSRRARGTNDRRTCGVRGRRGARGAPRSSTAREASDRVRADVGRWPRSQRLLRRRTRERAIGVDRRSGATEVGGRSSSHARRTLRACATSGSTGRSRRR
jgi:hypothetical protein